MSSINSLNEFDSDSWSWDALSRNGRGDTADQVESMSLDNLHQWLEERSTDIVEFAVDAQRQRVYVVPKSSAGLQNLGNGSQVSDSRLVAVKNIPVTNDGTPDFQRLADYQFVDADLARRCQTALPAEMQAVAVAREYFEPEKLLLIRNQYSGYTSDATPSGECEVDRRDAAIRQACSAGPVLTWSGPNHATLVDALCAAAAGDRGITYLEAGEQRFETYEELLAAARQTLYGLQQLGLKKGDPLPLQITDRREHFHVIWGCALGGIIPVTIAIPNRHEPDNPVFQKLLGVWKLLGAKHVLASTDSVRPLKDLFPADALVCDVAELDLSSQGKEATLTPDDVLFYQLTSGSTGTPKCIPETHAAIISHIKHSTVDVGYKAEDRTLNWLPFDHVVPMLTFHLKDIYLGCHAFQAPTPEILAQPLTWLDLMEKHRIDYSWSPNFGFKLVVTAIKKLQAESGGATPKWNLTSVKKLMNAGEQVTAEVCDDFLRLCGLKPQVMQPAFGMAEVCTCMTYANDYGTAGKSVHRVLKSTLPNIQEADESVPDSETLSAVDLGPPSPGVEIRITAGATDKVLGENQVGHLQIRGPCVMQGYFNNPKANEESFVGDGWFDSGDLGYLREGRLVLTGRAKEQIIVRGANFYAYEIEDSIAELEGCVASFVAATSVHSESAGTEAVIIFFVPDLAFVSDVALANLSKGLLIPKLKEVVARIHSHVASSFGVNPEFVIPVTESGFHKTTSGKIQRGAFKKRFLEGAYSNVCGVLKRALQQEGDCTPDWFCRSVWQRRDVWRASRNGTGDGTVVFQPSTCELGSKLKASAMFASDAPVPWERLREVLEAGEGRVRRIVYAWPCSSTAATNMHEYYGGLIKLCQCLSVINVDVELYVVTTGALFVGSEKDTNLPQLVQAGCLSGITKALAAELPCVNKAILIDVDAPLASDPTALALAIHAEFHCQTADQEIAIRNGIRYVKRYESGGDMLASEVADCTEREDCYFRPGGAYLITGGLGGIGVEVVKMVLEVEGTSILILGRSDDGHKRLQELGWLDSGQDARVSYAAVDLGTDYSGLKQRVEKFLRKCGKPLVGVFHLAGHYERQQVSELNEEAFAEAIKAKVEGSLHLHQVLKSLSTDVTRPTFVHFGSVASFFAGQGLAAYSGCCSFQETFSQYQRADGVDSRVYVWSIWENTGIGGRDRSLGFAPWVCPIEKTQGLFVLRTLLNYTRLASVCIGVNLRHPDLARVAANTDEFGFHSLCVFYTPQECIDASTIEGLAHNPRYVCIPQVPTTAQGSVDTEKLISSSIKALTAIEHVGPQNEIEEKIFEIWREVLRIKNLGREDIFFELGGDSLSWMEMVTRANKVFNLKMGAMQVMRYGTVAEFAEHVGTAVTSVDRSPRAQNTEDNKKNILITLKKGSDPSQPPLFLFPTVAGTTSCYNELLSHVNAIRPVVGILDPYLIGQRESRLLDFDRWMELYADAVQSRQPKGPYTFLSYSQGATWLWGTAEQLIRRGEVVERCIVLDPFFPGWNGCQDAYEWMATWVAKVLKIVPKSLLRGVIPWSYNRMIGVGSPMQTERDRELSIAKTYNRFTSFPENLWLYLVYLELDTGVRVLEDYSELKRYPKDEYEDAVDFVCQSCASKLENQIEAQYLKDVMYVLSYSLLRASTYTPHMLPDSTSVTVIAPERRGLSLCQETKLDQLISPSQLQEINVPVERFDRRRHVTGRLKGFYILSELHFRCMHDKQFIAKCVDVLQEYGVARD